MGFRFSKFGGNMGLKQSVARKLSRKLALSGRSKWVRQLKRSINPRKIVASDTPVSASSLGYQYNGRTLSQLMGGN